MPRVAFITWPKRALIALVFPALICSTTLGFSATTLATSSRSAPSSVTALSPRSSTIRSGSAPSMTSGRISFATRPVIVPDSTRRTSLARFSGVRPVAERATPRWVR